MSDEAAEQWRNWEQILGPIDAADALRGPDDTLDDTVEIDQDGSEGDSDETREYGDDPPQVDEMAQAGAADIAALLAQLTQANLDLAQRNIDLDQRAVVAAGHRAQEDITRAQVLKIDKCEGEDKARLRRWVRDLTTLEVTHPGVVIAVAERTSRGNLSDTLETFLADPANAPRNGILWPALRNNVENLLLGEAYEEVLRSEHRVIQQKAHESTGDYSERYLASAKAAYPEPWDRVNNQALIALFAEGLLDRRMARDVGVVLRKATLRETINQTRSYAGIEATMALGEARRGDVAAVAPAAAKEAPKTKAATEEDARFAALSKQIASVSTQLGEFRAGTRKPPAGGAPECFNCGKPGHFARDCRGPRRGGNRTPQRGGRGRTPARPARSTACYNCNAEGHFARDCYVNTPTQPRGRGSQHAYRRDPPRGRGGNTSSHTYNQSAETTHAPWSQRPAGGQQQVAAAAEYHNSNQGNW